MNPSNCLINPNLSDGSGSNLGVSMVLIWCNILCDSTKNIKRYAIPHKKNPQALGFTASGLVLCQNL